MNKIDQSRPVKFINPEKGEEKLIFMVTNFNEVSNRCYIQVINMEGWGKHILPSQLVSIDEIENIENFEYTQKCRFKVDEGGFDYFIVKENETHYEIVHYEKYDLFKKYEYKPERELYSEWIEKGELEIIE